MKGKNKLKITDEMIGSDELSSCCSTIADNMIIAGKDNRGGEDVTDELADLSEVNNGSSTAVKKMTKSSQKK